MRASMKRSVRSMNRSVRSMNRSVRNAFNRPVQRRHLDRYNAKLEADRLERGRQKVERLVHDAALQVAQGSLAGVTAATRAVGEARFKQTLEAFKKAHPELSDDDFQRLAHDAIERATQKAYARSKAAENASVRGRRKALMDAVERVTREHRKREGHRAIGLSPIQTRDANMLDDVVTVSRARPRTAMETSAAESRLSRRVSPRSLARLIKLGQSAAARRETQRPAVSRTGTTAVGGAKRDTRRSRRVSRIRRTIRRRRRTRRRVLKSQAGRPRKRKTGRRIRRK